MASRCEGSLTDDPGHSDRVARQPYHASGPGRAHVRPGQASLLDSGSRGSRARPERPRFDRSAPSGGTELGRQGQHPARRGPQQADTHRHRQWRGADGGRDPQLSGHGGPRVHPLHPGEDRQRGADRPVWTGLPVGLRPGQAGHAPSCRGSRLPERRAKTSASTSRSSTATGSRRRLLHPLRMPCRRYPSSNASSPSRPRSGGGGPTGSRIAPHPSRKCATR
jgi:hypothetical protein